jgi:hypothetical protein
MIEAMPGCYSFWWRHGLLEEVLKALGIISGSSICNKNNSLLTETLFKIRFYGSTTLSTLLIN